MRGILHIKPESAPAKRKSGHEGYEYIMRELVPRDAGEQCVIALYEIPPGKAAYPYHYHTENEEAFYILSGTGILRTPAGEQSVSAGDFLFFPANESGAHKLTNASETEMLVYLDFDTKNAVDAAFYPDSGKIGIWGMGINKLFRLKDQVDYFEGE